jgi:hypothetical protein
VPELAKGARGWLHTSESKRRARIFHLILTKNNSEKIFHPPVDVRAALLRLSRNDHPKLGFIDAVMNRIRPQNRFQHCFAKQEEFVFIHDKSNSPFSR